MHRLFRIAVPPLAMIAVAVASLVPAAAQSPEDQLALIALSNRLDAAVDAKDWAAARAVFADEIDVAFGADPVTMPADDLVGMWAQALYADKASFHLRGGHIVTFDGPDAARIASKGYAWNLLPGFEGGALWEVWGDYVYDAARVDGDWKLTRFDFTATHERGNAAVRT
ncbi:MAG: nuclear transport factor 2 family protein [Pseudomonadota bacterium]